MSKMDTTQKHSVKSTQWFHFGICDLPPQFRMKKSAKNRDFIGVLWTDALQKNEEKRHIFIYNIDNSDFAKRMKTWWRTPKSTHFMAFFVLLSALFANFALAFFK